MKNQTEGKDKKMKPKKRNIIIAGGCVVGVLAVTAGVLSLQKTETAETVTAYKETTVEKGNLIVGVTESGSVSIGSVTQEVELEESSSSSSSTSSMSMTGQSSAGGQNNSSGSTSQAALEVEAVYVAAGQKISEGDALLKISEESIEEYREELEEAVSDAKAALTEATLSAQKQQLEASYGYDSSIAAGNVAEASYNTAIEQLQTAVDDAYKVLEEAYEQKAFYQNLVDQGHNYAEELEAAEEAYEKADKAYQTAQNAYSTKSIEAKKSYDEAMLNYSNAEGQYSIDVNGIDSDISDANDSLEEAQEALAEFEAFIGDGTIYSEYGGTITAVGYAAGDELSTSTSIVTFSDAEAVTMTVSVSEEDISEIAIGDVVNIELLAYEDTYFEGVVSGVDTSTSSGSSTVSYDVTVLFSGDTNGIYTDMTGNVTFIQKQVEDVVYVSNKAIINEGTSSYVKVKNEDGSTSKVQVITGFSDGVNVEISSGLEEGQTVLIESQVVSE